MRTDLVSGPLAWLAARLVHLVLLDGLSYRRAGRMVGISKTEWATVWTCCLTPWPRWVLPA
jgi:hypothetical protein